MLFINRGVVNTGGIGHCQYYERKMTSASKNQKCLKSYHGEPCMKVIFNIECFCPFKFKNSSCLSCTKFINIWLRYIQ